MDVVNDTMQVLGGQAYFTDQPYERWMRDARINTIGEGANDVLKAFIAVVGCRGPGMRLDAMRKRPMANLHRLAGYGAGHLWRKSFLAGGPGGPGSVGRAASLAARRLARQVEAARHRACRAFPAAGTRRSSSRPQLVHERLADIAIDLYVSSCVLSRLDHMIQKAPATSRPADFAGEVEAGKYFLALADRRIDERFAGLTDNDDTATVNAADAALALGGET